MPLIEKRYAEALVDIAVQSGNIDGFQQEFGAIVDLVNGNSDLKVFLQNPEIKIDVKKGTIHRILSNSISTELLSFILLLLDKGRIKYLNGIFREFVRMADHKKNVLNMRILSAIPMEVSQVEAIKEKYRKAYHALSVKASVEVDKSLIGGVKVIIGDKVIDGTAKGRLEGLREALVGN